MGSWKNEGYAYRTASTRLSDLCYAFLSDPVLTNDGLPHTVVTTFDEDRWCNVEMIKWNVISSTIPSYPKHQCVAIGEHGNVLVKGNNDFFDEKIIDVQRPEPGLFREVRSIGGYAHVCGMDRCVYRRDAPGQWTCIDQNIGKLPAEDPYVFGFESIHGFALDDIYAVGWHGEIWHFDGTGWHQLDSPTNLLLNRVYCAPNGVVYIAGQSGLLLRGRKDDWEILKHDSTSDDIWDLEWFNGQLYISTLHALFILEKGKLELVETGEEQADTFHHLDAADGILWSIGARDILEYNGTNWRRID